MTRQGPMPSIRRARPLSLPVNKPGSRLGRVKRAQRSRSGVLVGLLRVFPVGRANHPQMADIAPRLQKPASIVVVEDVETGIHKFKAARGRKGNGECVSEKPTQNTPVSYHHNGLANMPFG